MLVIIIISTIELAIDNPLNDKESILQQTLAILDYNLTAIFIIEAILKIIANGFVNCGSKSYIRSMWNTLDFFIVGISVTHNQFNHILLDFIFDASNKQPQHYKSDQTHESAATSQGHL